ncbi:hypothetical protein [Alcanivorax quisquiliarum]|uniref:Uncharacterized protein n=1 Tax=Alcanivorax quisquiliarum TaxID=2933565 RepID=A0ABT0E9C6_9GAMM|nr:hypothetical protein [Alcanivorax quisquiliarum]MCK0538338.1 hypothetical protein [Alcanivorax quisquiliarum]
MTRFNGPEEVYAELVDKQPENEDWLLGLVAFAVVEEQRVEWVKHHSENNGGPPTDADIRNWYLQLPSGALLRARDTAEARLTDYARSAIEIYMADFQKEIEEGIIVSEVRETKKFWPQFGVNLAGGLVSALLFASLLTLMAVFVLNDSSPVKIGQHLVN